MDAGEKCREEWRRNGLRLQLVSRWILPRLDFRIVKAEEDPISARLPLKLQRLSSYLMDYSDYIVSKQNRLYIIEVKAPATPRVTSGGMPLLFRPPVKFTCPQTREFPQSPIPVKVLLWDYGMEKSLSAVQDRVFFTLVDFEEFKNPDVPVDGVKLQLPSCAATKPRWILPKTLKHLLRRSNAESVIDIKPGCVIRG